MERVKIANVIQLFLILIGEMRFFGETKPSLTERKVLVTADITRTSMQSMGYPKTPEQVDYLMYVLQFSSSDVPNLYRIYKKETNGATLDDKLEAAMSIFGQINYVNIDDANLVEIAKINSLIKGTYCKKSTNNSTSQSTYTGEPDQRLYQLSTSEDIDSISIKPTKEAQIGSDEGIETSNV